jgi:hypothetical protein
MVSTKAKRQAVTDAFGDLPQLDPQYLGRLHPYDRQTLARNFLIHLLGPRHPSLHDKTAGGTMTIRSVRERRR